MNNRVRNYKCRYTILAVCVLSMNCLALQAYAEDKPVTKSEKPVKSVTSKQVKQLFYPALTEREEMLEKTLNSETNANFPEIPLNEVMDYFSELHNNAPIKIQAKALEDNGITVEQIVDVNLSKISLKNSLIQILDPIGLTYVVDREMILITSQEKTAEMMKTRVYPVGDLCSSDVEYLILENAIRSSILGNWDANYVNYPSNGLVRPVTTSPKIISSAKGGTISVVPQSKSLVITQTYHAQNAITELLTDLRKARADQQKITGQEL